MRICKYIDWENPSLQTVYADNERYNANCDINCDTGITGLLQEQLIGADNNRTYVQ